MLSQPGSRRRGSTLEEDEKVSGLWILLALAAILGVGAGMYGLTNALGTVSENIEGAETAVASAPETPSETAASAVSSAEDSAVAETSTVPATPKETATEADATPEVEAEIVTGDEAVAEEIEETPLPPAFDTFRVEPDGSMLVAGRAEPGQRIDIMLSDEVIDSVLADGSGGFVSFATAGASDQPRSLSLVADPEGRAIKSETSFFVAPIARSAQLFAQAEEPALPASPDAPDAPEVAVALDDALPTNEPDPQQIIVDAEPNPVQLPPTVLQADTDGIRVVQSSPDALQTVPNVGLDAITYDPTGDVQLSGRAVGDGAVQVYIDNRPVIAAPVNEGGDWQLELPDIDTGVYTLRIDELDDEGDVVSRLETPFRREEAAEVAAVLAEETAQPGFDVAVRTVQPGATLWAIAEENLGDGIYYVAVFEANRDLIKDPNLIYPGQIFRIPDLDRQ